MSRNLKVFGLIALAITTVVVSPSQASILTTAGGSYPASLHAVQEGSHDFLVNSRTITCSKATLSGDLSGATENVQLNPSYESCHTIVFGATWPVTVTTNGCSYIVRETVTVGQITIGCPSGKNIDIHMYSSHANHTSGTSVCTYHAGPQLINMGVVIFDGVNAIDMYTETAEIALTLTSGSTVTCGVSSQTARYTSKTVMSATVGGNQASIHWK